MNKFLPLVLFVILAWFLYSGLGKDSKKLPSPLIGKAFPQMQVEDFKTSQTYLIQTQLKNQVSLVNVWASWCVTCRAEHQMLNHISKAGLVQMLGINYKDSKQNASQYLQELHNPYNKIVFDTEGKLGLELGVYATPETFIVDKQGIIRYKLIGELTYKIWQSDILPLIQKLNAQIQKNNFQT